MKAILAAAVCILAISAGALAIPQPEAKAVASQPASAPSQEKCRLVADNILSRVDGSFIGLIQPPFVVIGNCSPDQLSTYASDSIMRPAEIMWRMYFHNKPDEVITVLLFEDDASYRQWTAKLLGDTDVSHFGYYRPDSRTLAMNISTGTGTLVHELTHALIAYDFPDVPLWFNEGLASLHEQCSIGPDGITGLANWRLKELQKAIREKQLRPLADLVTKDDFYGPYRSLNYGQARYFVMYMQQKGLLEKFYNEFKANHTAEKSAITAIEKIFDKKIDQVEGDFLGWVMNLKFPG